MALFTSKYAPQNTSQVFGQDLALSQLRHFVMSYSASKFRAALIEGPSGCGKTSSVYALARELGYDVLELNSSEDRDEESVRKFLLAALGQQSLFFRPKVVLVDEVDNLSGSLDRGGVGALVEGISKSKFPVVFTANDTSESKFKPLVKSCLRVEFFPLDFKIVVHALLLVCEREGIKAEEKAISALARQCGGDLRGAMLDLQVLSESGRVTFDRVSTLSEREKTESMVSALSVIFKSSRAENALSVLDDVDVEMNEVFLWLDYNLPFEYVKAADLARAYECLARADVFNGRIMRRQHWRFLSYVQNLLTAGISSAKDARYPTSITYKQTMRLLRIWQMKMKVGKRKEIALKLGRCGHMSSKEAYKYVAYLPSLVAGNSAIGSELGLSEEEVEFLRSK